MKSLKIWIAISTPFQANFFCALIETLREKADFFVTAREHDNITKILDARKVVYEVVGKHGGKDRLDKLNAYAQTVTSMIPLVNSEKPDLMITERWPEAVRVAFGLNVPIWTLFYDEREYHVNRMVFPLSSKVFAPDFYTSSELRDQGVLSPSLVTWFKGFHAAYLKTYHIEGSDPFKEMGLSHPIVLVRSEPRFASFFPEEKDILYKSVHMLMGRSEYKKGEFDLVALPRDEVQKQQFTKLAVPIINGATADNPVLHADLVLGAAETMLMEAFVLCKPAVSAIYWDESKPVRELHKYIPHSINPNEITEETLQFLLDKNKLDSFQRRARSLVSLMENPILKMNREVMILGEGAEKKSPKRRRRSREDISVELIRMVSLSPRRLTSLMSSLNISYSVAKELVGKLTRKGLFEETYQNKGIYYTATESAIRLLEDYERVKEALD